MRRSSKRKIFAITLLILICFWLVSSVGNLISQLNYKKTYEYKLIRHGYDDVTAKYFEDFFDQKYLDYLLEIEKNEHIKNLTEEKYFILANLKDYIKYIEETKNDDYNEIITIINVGLNRDFYTDIEESDITINPYHILVNKYYQLPEDYQPEQIVDVSNIYAYANRKIDNSIYEILKKMWADAKEDDTTLILISGFRNFETQAIIYQNYLSSDGRLNADRYSARPGHSEHQLGTALDIVTHGYGLVPEFDETKEFKWLSENAYKYGFILRYPKEKEHITGYMYEPWHFRYVGLEVAEYIQNNDITFDEYYAFYLRK